ncbi:hypothetical protein LTR53_017434 [Teratosphaeriaceae sp. CCFEE 6253]|nr:hypothetical protein LTR53_017434 [Teratosphaeriaceae sp. CCFEE 6253]
MDSPRSVMLSPKSTQPPRPKSPPLAFEPTSNDSLAPLTSPARSNRPFSSISSPLHPTMGIMSPQASAGAEMDLQVVVDQQASAIQLLHDAFAAERQAWSLERERLYYRIGSLEQLLKTRDHHSPAKSPVISPSNGAASDSNGSITSPQVKAISSVPRLPSIAEDENMAPLHTRRGSALQSIDFPGRRLPSILTEERASRSQRGSTVSFDGDVMVEDGPRSPPPTARNLSPLPPNNRALAGHTPLKAPPRPLTPPDGMAIDGSEDTPTRYNTHINLFLTKGNEYEDDVPLKGPLSMPELPNKPDETNFTLEALSKRLEQVARSPGEARPMVFAQPSPGLASPAEPAETSSRRVTPPTGFLQSPPAVLSPSSVTTQPQEFNGVKLKKKASTNFGAPFGQLGGFGGRKMS